MVSGSFSSPTRSASAAPAPLGTAGTAAIEVSHLTKVFGSRTAVADVSFSVARGEVFGFLGPNGAGKTTTVRILGTLISPTAGSAVVAGLPLSPANAEEIRQRISIMPEAPGLYRRLTVTENLDFFARLYGLPQREQRISEALAAVGPLEQPDEVVLLTEGDEDVLDGVVEAERLHRPHLRPDDLGVARGRDVEVQVLAAAQRAERHPAFPVHQARAERPVDGHGFLQGYLNVHLLLPSQAQPLARLTVAKD